MLMDGRKERRPSRGIALLAGSVLLVSAGWAPAFADPPSWAPAHGYRAKFGDIGAGTCQRGLSSPEIIGLLAGAALGGYAGSKLVKGEGKNNRTRKLAATGAGVFLGALVGSAIGRSMGTADQLCVAKSLESARDNQAVAWRNPDADANYTVTPLKSYDDRTSGRYCREYITEATIAGEVQQTYGTACRQPDGSWELVT